MQTAIYLSSKDVVGLADMDEYIDAVRDGYRQRGEGASADNRTRISSDTDSAASLVSYGASMPDSGVMGRYTMCPSSATAGWYLTQLYSSDGDPLAVLDGASWNPLKTGAVGAVGVDALAREDASTVGLIGSGEQSKGQLVAIERVRDIDEAYVFSPTKSHREAFVEHMSEYVDCEITAVGSSDAAVEGSDIVVTATKAEEPVFDGSKLETGAHINAVGQGEPDKREIDVTAMEQAKYVPDHRDRALAAAGSFLYAIEAGAITEDHLYAELGEIVAGKVPGRESDDEVTLFDTSGMGMEAISAAELLYRKAKEQGVGTEIEFYSADEAFDFVDYIETDW